MVYVDQHTKLEGPCSGGGRMETHAGHQLPWLIVSYNLRESVESWKFCQQWHKTKDRPYHTLPNDKPFSTLEVAVDINVAYYRMNVSLRTTQTSEAHPSFCTITSFHLLHLSVPSQLLIKHHLWILMNQIAILIITIFQEHCPVHLCACQVECSGLLLKHLVCLPSQAELLLELHNVMY